MWFKKKVGKLFDVKRVEIQRWTIFFMKFSWADLQRIKRLGNFYLWIFKTKFKIMGDEFLSEWKRFGFVIVETFTQIEVWLSSSFLCEMKTSQIIEVSKKSFLKSFPFLNFMEYEDKLRFNLKEMWKNSNKKIEKNFLL